MCWTVNPTSRSVQHAALFLRDLSDMQRVRQQVHTSACMRRGMHAHTCAQRQRTQTRKVRPEFGQFLPHGDRNLGLPGRKSHWSGRIIVPQSVAPRSARTSRSLQLSSAIACVARTRLRSQRLRCRRDTRWQTQVNLCAMELSLAACTGRQAMSKNLVLRDVCWSLGVGRHFV